MDLRSEYHRGNRELIGDADSAKPEPVSDNRIIEWLTQEVEALRRRNEELAHENVKLKSMVRIMAGME